jgi:LmbE family N-acetylglucosaminyl deacetylase
LELPAGPLRLTCLGAHCDDIEIGAGATLLRLLEEHPGSTVTWVVVASDPVRRAEAEAAAAVFCGDAGSSTVVIGDFAENVFPWHGEPIKQFVNDATDPAAIDVVFAPRPDDLHQDHRLIAEIALQRFRDHPILGYEIAKYDGDLATPNVYVGLEDRHADRKIGILLQTFASQRHRPWFDDLAFRALLRLRGVECNRRYAEGFHTRKLTL